MGAPVSRPGEIAQFRVCRLVTGSWWAVELALALKSLTVTAAKDFSPVPRDTIAKLSLATCTTQSTGAPSCTKGAETLRADGI